MGPVVRLEQIEFREEIENEAGDYSKGVGKEASVWN